MVFFEEYETGLEPIVLVRSSLSEKTREQDLQAIANYLNPTRRVAVVINSKGLHYNAVLFLNQHGFLSLVTRTDKTVKDLEANVLCLEKTEEQAAPKVIITQGRINLSTEKEGLLDDGREVSLIRSYLGPVWLDLNIRGCFQIDKESRTRQLLERDRLLPTIKNAFSFAIDIRRFGIVQSSMLGFKGLLLIPSFFVENSKDVLSLDIYGFLNEKRIGGLFNLLTKRFFLKNTFLEKTHEMIRTQKSEKMFDIFLFGIQVDVDMIRATVRAFQPKKAEDTEGEDIESEQHYCNKVANKILSEMKRNDLYLVESLECLESMENNLKRASLEEGEKEELLRRIEELKIVFKALDIGKQKAHSSFLMFIGYIFLQDNLFHLNDVCLEAQAMRDRFKMLADMQEENIQKTLDIVHKLHVFNREFHLFCMLSPRRLSVKEILGLVNPEDIKYLTTSLINLFEDAILMFCVKPPAGAVKYDEITQKLEKRASVISDEFDNIKTRAEDLTKS